MTEILLHVIKELEQAKSVVEDLENELKEERTRLRLLTTEQTRAEKQKEKLTLQLDRAESVSQIVPDIPLLHPFTDVTW